jgi:DNA-binding IscR family transcriptional regulator
MNHQVSLVIGDTILGDGRLQQRFIAYVEVLEHFVRRGPRPVCLARAADMSGFPVAALRRRVHELGRAGILKKVCGAADTWCLEKDPADVTLEDVLVCAAYSCASRRRKSASASMPAPNMNIELLLTLAAKAVDDHLCKTLRTYSLDRLAASRTAPSMVRFDHESVRRRQIFSSISDF